MGMTSYFSRSRAPATKRAEARETSCSAERPPKIRASLNIAGKRSGDRAARKLAAPQSAPAAAGGVAIVVRTM